MGVSSTICLCLKAGTWWTSPDVGFPPPLRCLFRGGKNGHVWPFHRFQNIVPTPAHNPQTSAPALPGNLGWGFCCFPTAAGPGLLPCCCQPWRGLSNPNEDIRTAWPPISSSHGSPESSVPTQRDLRVKQDLCRDLLELVDAHHSSAPTGATPGFMSWWEAFVQVFSVPVAHARSTL